MSPPLAFLFFSLSDWRDLITSPVWLAMTVFQIWMFVHAVRQREWIWAFFIFIGSGIAAFFYYFYAYRSAPSSTRGFELPGAHDRRRIKELQAKIHHLDKAHFHSELADIYFQQGKLDLAAASYRAALDREPDELDTRAHYGQCLLRQKKPAEARPLLEGVIAQNPKHDYGYTRMALAETLTALGETDAALKTWLQVTAAHSYPRAKVQLAELYLAKNEPAPARAQLQEVLADDAHTLPFQRKRDRVWVRRAKALLRKLT